MVYIMKKNYIIHAPKYSKSNGVRVLYKLGEELEKKGYKAYIYGPKSEEYTKCEYIDKITPEMKKNDIVVYPEIIWGNPLGFNNVVRYILYYPGKLGGSSYYPEDEQLFKYLSEFYPECKNRLTIPTLDRDLFYSDDTPKTKDCVFIYKGGKWKDIPELAGLTEITSKYPEKREDLAQLLRETKTLYSYDDCTLLLDEATVCGCQVKIIRQDGYEEYNSKIYELYAQWEEQFKVFIDITQKMNNKKCTKSFIFNILKCKIYYLLKILYFLFTHKFDKAKNTYQDIKFSFYAYTQKK